MSKKIQNYITRGSEWRKWDLHIHTPNTKLNNQYSVGDKEDLWDKFCEKIEASEVSVFGITDYFSIDNFLIFVDKYSNKYPSSKKVFFPNVEFRIESKNSKDEHIQFHIIFSNEKDTLDKINNFFTRLKLVSTDNKDLTNKYCTNSDLSQIGYEKAMVFIQDLEKQVSDDFTEDEYLMIGVANGYGSLRPNGKGDGRGSEYAKELDKKCKLFFGVSKNNDFFLNKGKENTGRSKYNLPPKPIVFGCDAHSFKDIDNKLGKYYEEKDEKGKIKNYSEITWIKADTTFEGLRQIVYEPEDRVRIQELRPEEKEEYQLIDTVAFVDDSFAPDEILINSNLTAIIGGKSTGKSILLRNIAQSIDPEEVAKRLSDVSLKEYDKTVDSFKVTWKDKQEYVKGLSSDINKKIIYIPQSYLNRLIDKKEDKTAIDEIIKNVLKQDPEIETTFEELKDSQRDIERKISSQIEDLFFLEKDYKTILAGIKEIGDKKGIESEISKLKKEITDLKISSGLTDKEIKEYGDLSESIKSLRSKQESITRDVTSLKVLQTKPFFEDIDLSNISEELVTNLQREFDELRTRYSTEIQTKIDNAIKTQEGESAKLTTILNQNLEAIAPLHKKVAQSKVLDERIKKLDAEEIKLKKILHEEKLLETKKNEYLKVRENMVVDHSSFFENIFKAKGEILKQKVITGELTFDIAIEFRQELFQKEFIEEVCNLRNISQFTDVSFDSFKYKDNASFRDDIEKILKGIISEKLILKNNYSKQDAIRKLLRNWFIFDFKIQQNGDELSEMSPGKKSFVLLKLLIELDNSKCPILLDQPEDDLDNRSIYMDLVRFIKEKKRERQIIIATHNPNLVVGADAECIIVANQGGEGAQNLTYKFEYVSGSLEHSFKSTKEDYVLIKQGIQEHVCEILEGGRDAFESRKNKYNIN